MTTAMVQQCPSCQGDLAGQSETHCKIEGRLKLCGWIKHRCGVVVDPRSGRFIAGLK